MRILPLPNSLEGRLPPGWTLLDQKVSFVSCYSAWSSTTTLFLQSLDHNILEDVLVKTRHIDYSRTPNGPASSTAFYRSIIFAFRISMSMTFTVLHCNIFCHWNSYVCKNYNVHHFGVSGNILESRLHVAFVIYHLSTSTSFIFQLSRVSCSTSSTSDTLP